MLLIFFFYFNEFMNLKSQVKKKICVGLHLFVFLCFCFFFFKQKYYRIIKTRKRDKNREAELEWNCELQVIMAIEETVNF